MSPLEPRDAAEAIARLGGGSDEIKAAAKLAAEVVDSTFPIETVPNHAEPTPSAESIIDAARRWAKRCRELERASGPLVSCVVMLETTLEQICERTGGKVESAKRVGLPFTQALDGLKVYPVADDHELIPLAVTLREAGQTPLVVTPEGWAITLGQIHVCDRI